MFILLFVKLQYVCESGIQFIPQQESDNDSGHDFLSQLYSALCVDKGDLKQEIIAQRGYFL